MSLFRKPKSKEEEHACVSSSVPKNTRYATNWAITRFCDWQKTRSNKKAEFETTSFIFAADIKSLQDADKNLDEMQAESLNFSMIKFLQEEVAKKMENCTRQRHYTASYVAALNIFRGVRG